MQVHYDRSDDEVAWRESESRSPTRGFIISRPTDLLPGSTQPPVDRTHFFRQLLRLFPSGRLTASFSPPARRAPFARIKTDEEARIFIVVFL